jgi:Phosphopantetheine attachment site
MAILDDLRAASEADRFALLLGFIEDQVMEMLEWPQARRAELSRGFAAIGFDSMMSVDLQFCVQSELDFAAPSADDFLQPSAEALAQHLLDAHLLPLDYPLASSPSVQQMSG